MISQKLKQCSVCSALNSLPLMGAEEMRRVPKLPGSVSDELDALPRVPVDGHEMYSAGAGEVDQAYVGTVYQRDCGRWAYRIESPLELIGQATFFTEDEAQAAMKVRLRELNA